MHLVYTFKLPYLSTMLNETNTTTMTTTQITPLSQVNVEFFVNAKMPNLNKQENWADYLVQMENTSVEKVQVSEIITLSNEDFSVFRTSLLNDYDFLAGKGGTNSTFDLGREIEHIWEMTTEEMEAWRNEAYAITVMVQNQEGENILVDPQGYKYARYCGMVATK